MAFSLIYRLEFKNFEENIIRIDISSGNVAITTGNTLSIATNIAFSNSGGFIQILTYPSPFFYVGMTFTVTGSVSNDGAYSVTSLTGSVGGPLTIFVPQALTDEYVGTGPVVFTDTSTTEPQVITLQGTGTPLVISTINNDQDKFQPVRSKQAVIQFVSDSSIPADISTFSAGPDNKWSVDISIIGITPYLFRGFLIMSDNQQPFQPDPQTVQLTATDHLGALKDLDLLDYNSGNPVGVYRMADMIMMCLRRTGLFLDLFVVNNLRVGSGQVSLNSVFTTPNVFATSVTTFFYPGQTIVISGTGSNNGTFTVVDVLTEIFTFVMVVETLTAETVNPATYTEVASGSHIYDVARVDAKTFEKQIGVSEDCYTVLSKLLGKDCYVCQWAGAWWIMRVDEFNSFDIYTAHYDNRGRFVDIDTVGTNYDISVGATETRRFANADTLLQFIRPHGFTELDYPFDLPLEIPSNVDFERGLLNNDVNDSQKHYDLDNFNKLWSNTSTDDPATTPIYIRRDFVNDQEVKRYVVIELDPTGNLNFIMSEPIPVNKLDKFDIDISVRLSSDLGGSGFYRINSVQVRLYGNDGSFWTCHGGTSVAPIPEWVATDVTFRTSQRFFVMEGDLSEDFTASHSLYLTKSAEIPVQGYLRILIYANTEDPTAKSTYIDKLTFDYIPFINGSYQKYTGDYNRVDRIESGYMAKLQQDVNIADGPNRLTKGAIQIGETFRELITDTIQFIEPNYLLIPGNWTVDLYPGLIIKITGTTLNDQITIVSLVTYHVIPDNTEVQILGVSAPETSAAVVFQAVLALTKNWYSAQELALAINTDPSKVHSYGYIQIFSVWNQFRGSDNADGEGEGINIFTGSVIGLTTTWPDLLYKFLITDTDDQTVNRYFMLLSMSQDWRSCIWTASLVEVFNTVTGRVFGDNYSFKYIAN